MISWTNFHVPIRADESEYEPEPTPPPVFDRLDAIDLDRLSLIRMSPGPDIDFEPNYPPPSQPVALLSPAEIELNDLRLLQKFVNSSEERRRAIILHHAFKRQRPSSNAEMIRRWELALDFYDTVTSMDVWEVKYYSLFNIILF